MIIIINNIKFFINITYIVINNINIIYVIIIITNIIMIKILILPRHIDPSVLPTDIGP